MQKVSLMTLIFHSLAWVLGVVICSEAPTWQNGCRTCTGLAATRWCSSDAPISPFFFFLDSRRPVQIRVDSRQFQLIWLWFWPKLADWTSILVETSQNRPKFTETSRYLLNFVEIMAKIYVKRIMKINLWVVLCISSLKLVYIYNYMKNYT